MSCEQCEDAEKTMKTEGRAFYFRLGNAMIGYGNISVECCEEHASLLQAIVRGTAKRTEDGQWIKTEASFSWTTRRPRDFSYDSNIDIHLTRN